MSKRKIFIAATIISIAACTVFTLQKKNRTVEANSNYTITLNVTDEHLVSVGDIEFEIYKDNEIVDTIVSNHDGIATSRNLQPGIYQYKMTGCNNYYLLDSFVNTVELNNSDKNINFIVQKSSYKLEIKSVDQQNTPIENICFEVYDNNNNLIEQIFSDTDGIAMLDGLLPGGYSYRISTFPNGNITDNFTKTFSISNENKKIELIFIN